MKWVKGLAEHLDSKKPQSFLVFDCNWQAFDVFLLCTTQWRFRPSGELHALDYSSVRSVIEMLGVSPKRQADVFRRVTQIESGALDALHKHK